MRLVFDSRSKDGKLSFDAPHKSKMIEGAKERWIHICSAKSLPLKGVEVTSEHFEQMVSNFYAEDDALPVFRGHSNLYEHGAEAIGWIIGLHTEAGKLYALVESGPDLEVALSKGGYRLCSIDAQLLAKSRNTGKEIGARLNSLGMTNEPAVDGLMPIAASNKTDSYTIIVLNNIDQKDSPFMAEQVENKDEKEEEKKEEEVAAEETSPDEMAALMADLMKVASEVSGAEMDGPGAVAMAIEAMKAMKPSEEEAPTEAEQGSLAAERTALSAQITSLNADNKALLDKVTSLESQLAEKENAEKEAELNAVVDGAIKAGQIHLSARDSFLSWARADLDGFKQALPTLRAVNLGKSVVLSSKEETADPTEQLDTNQKEILEIAKKKYLKR